MAPPIIGPTGEVCEENINHKVIKLSGHRTSTLYLLNPAQRQVVRILVDNCAIYNGPRCDWLVCARDNISNEEIFVELKGSDLGHAVKQLEATIPQLSTDPKHGSKRCYVASTRNPLTDTEAQRYKVRFKRDYNARFLPTRDG